jgi:outer membrane protein
MRKIIRLFCVLGVFIAALPAAANEPGTLTFTVAEAVQEALRKNPAMREATAGIDAARASKQHAAADMLPEASFHYGYTYLKEEPTQFGTQVASQDQYTWDITVVQPLFTGFALKSQFDLARLNIMARELEKEQTQLDLVKNVKSACFNLLLAEKLLQVNEEEVETLAAHKRDAELIYKQGLVRMNDVLKADVSLAGALQQREQARARVWKAKILLNRLLDRPLREDIVIVEPETYQERHHDLPSLSEKALTDRPLMKLLDNSLKQLGLSKTLAKSTWYPKVSLMGRYEQNGEDWTASDNDYANFFNTSVGVVAEWTFWRSGKTSADIRRVNREMAALTARIDLLKGQVVEEVNHAVLDCEVALSNIGTASRSLVQAEENWRITQKQYKHQIATSTDVLDARTFLTGADTNYNTAVYGYLVAVAALERAVGERGVD